MSARKQIPYLLLLLVSLVYAGQLRWQFVQNINLYPDEFVTLLAMDMVTQKGAPILPSGLFYDHGLLYSYLAGGAALWGEPALAGRLTSLVLGLLTICLTYWLGQRWFSPAAGLLAAIGLSLAPVAIHWHGRVRMYALLQLLVLLSLIFILEGVFQHRRRAAWLSVASYLGALLTQFVSLALLPPLLLAELIGRHSRADRPDWYRDRQLWLRGAALGLAVLIAFWVKRAGQPKGIEPLVAGNAIGGLWQVFTIYTSFSVNLAESWAALAPFYLGLPGLIFSIGLLLALGAAFWQKPRYAPNLFLALVLLLTTVEILLIAPADRRDDKYLFMLLPVLLVLGGHGWLTLITALGTFLSNRFSLSRAFLLGFDRLVLIPMRRLFGGRGVTMAMEISTLFLRQPRQWFQLVVAILISVWLWQLTQPQITDLLTDVGEDYSTTFAYVAEHMRPGEAILTGTPAAAYYYLGRNDYYAVQAGGAYDYRILASPDGLVERWLGSPWLQTPEAVNAVFAEQPVWLVLERWGLLIQYYQPLFMQNILAQTEFIREDNGIIALKSLPKPMLLPENPTVPVEADLGNASGPPGHIRLEGYSLEAARLTLYWRVVAPMSENFSVFVNVQDQTGQTVLQTDHPPLGSVYPTTLWPPGLLMRETSRLELPPGQYELRVGMYLLETEERLWVPGDETRQNMAYLGEIAVGD